MKFLPNGLKDIIGINKRNLDIISVYNKRKYFPIVDNKIKTKEYLEKDHIPFPETLCVITNFFEIETSIQLLSEYDTFVIKPSRGRAGGGVLLLEKLDVNNWQSPSGKEYNRDDLIKHLSDILFGVYSFGLQGDSVLVEKRVRPHSIFTEIFDKGVADIRIITFQNKPMMAMLRIPTEKSDGKANLHQGALGVPVDLVSGLTGKAKFHGRTMLKHPDSNRQLESLKIPFWNQIMEYSVRSSKLIPLGYIGVDLVIDKDKGPLILELNARPGLQIQVINEQGLLPLIGEENL